jgi:hypothetical protein
LFNFAFCLVYVLLVAKVLGDKLRFLFIIFLGWDFSGLYAGYLFEYVKILVFSFLICVLFNYFIGTIGLIFTLYVYG